jgi:hypothetical protein
MEKNESKKSCKTGAFYSTTENKCLTEKQLFESIKSNIGKKDKPIKKKKTKSSKKTVKKTAVKACKMNDIKILGQCISPREKLIVEFVPIEGNIDRLFVNIQGLTKQLIEERILDRASVGFSKSYKTEKIMIK